MEKYDVKNHLFYDGYGLSKEKLRENRFILILLGIIKKHIFNGKGIVRIIPYFNGKVEEDGGISGIILGEGFHFTCHTFCYKGTVFIDFFGSDDKKAKIAEILQDYFATDDFDMGSKDKEGYFGKHIIVDAEPTSLQNAKLLVQEILDKIHMTPISQLIVRESSSENFDLLQPIAESHISFHRNENGMIVDAFSCKYFDKNEFLRIINENDCTEVQRGLRYK